MKTHSYSAMS